MKIKIWGSRGSIPTPLKPEIITHKICQAIHGMPNIDTNNLKEVQAYVDGLHPLCRGTAGGNTACVEIRTSQDIFIIDAGSGIRELGLALLAGPCGRGQGRLHIFFSHPHWDHIQGFPFFVPAFIPGKHLTFYGIHDVEKILVDQQCSLNFPVPLPYMQAKMDFVTLHLGQPWSIGSLKVNTLKNYHPGDAYSFRFEDQQSIFVYASDSEYKHLDEASVRKPKGHDFVIDRTHNRPALTRHMSVTGG